MGAGLRLRFYYLLCTMMVFMFLSSTPFTSALQFVLDADQEECIEEFLSDAQLREVRVDTGEGRKCRDAVRSTNAIHCA